MHKRTFTGRYLIIFFLILLADIANANVNAIDFSKIQYPPALQPKIDFLRRNLRIYDHWSPEWHESISKKEVTGNLTTLYTGLDQITNKNAETLLLLGDIAHYLYNMGVEEYYQKALDNYQKAQALTPNDYRVYWFLGNHYSLSAQSVLSIKTYQIAQKYMQAQPPTAYWADYSIACANAGMFNNASFAAHKYSVGLGQPTALESQISGVAKHMLKAPPVDTTIQDKECWDITDQKGASMTFTNYIMSFQFKVDSSWQLELGGYQKNLCYATISPQQAITKSGEKVGYSFLVLVRTAQPNETLQQFLDNFSGKAGQKQKIVTDLNKKYGGLAYEWTDASAYPDCGGGHGYAIAVERDIPQFPNLELETPMEIPKGEAGKMSYYRAPERFNRIKSKLYYFILLDSCEKIHDESAAVFNNFLNNLVID